MKIRTLFVFILFASFYAMSVQKAHDPDLWWHLRTGEYILENGIPRQDPPFSFTVTDHEWITHEWMSEVLMISVYKVAGLNGLSFVFAGFVALAFALLYWSSSGRPYLAGFVCLWGIAASLPFINVRPQMFNILFGAAFVFLVERFRNGQLERKWLWLMVPLTIVWANLHSGFLLGSVILGVYVVGGALQLFFSSPTDERDLSWPQIRFLVIVAAISFLAAAVNPNTYLLWIYPFLTLGSEAMQSTIAEWQSPDFHNWVFWIYGGMLLGGLVAMVYSKERKTWTDILFFLGAGAAGLQSVRHIPVFVTVAVPIICRHLLGTFRETRAYPLLSGRQPEGALSPTMRRLNWVLAGLVVVVAIVWFAEELGDLEESIVEEFPVAAVDYLEAEGLDQARIFNDYNWGGYLIWRGVPTFIDGRADVYGDDFIFYYLQTFHLKENWQEPLDEFAVEYILTQNRGALSVLLETSPEWKVIYRDDVADIYGRVQP